MTALRRRAGELLYAGINLPLMIVHGTGAAMVLPALWAKHAGLSLIAIGGIMAVLRIVDVLIDPAIGYLSDRTRSRFGRRKPWIVAGAGVLAIGTLLAFNPSADSGYLWFAAANFLLVLGWSMIEIPHLGWLNELTGDYQGRSRLATQRHVAGLLGNALFLALPLSGLFVGTAVTPQVTGAAAWLMIGLFAVVLPLALLLLPDGGGGQPAAGSSIREVLRSVRGNAPFGVLAAVQTISFLASGIVSGLFFFWLDGYLRLGDKYSHVMLPVMVFSFVGALFWLRVTVRVDKHRIVAACSCVTAATNIAMFLIAPGEWALTALIVSFALSIFAGAGGVAARISLTADSADYGTLRSGNDHAGNYFAAMFFIEKCSAAIGSGLGLMIVGLFGFKATGGNDALAMSGFWMTVVFIPCALNLLAAAIAWRFPIDRARQQVIRAELEARAAAAGAGGGGTSPKPVGPVHAL